MLLERRTGEDSSECRTGPVIDLVKETRRHIQEIEQDLASYRLLDLVELPGLGQLVDLRERSVFLTSHGLEDLPGDQVACATGSLLRWTLLRWQLRLQRRASSNGYGVAPSAPVMRQSALAAADEILAARAAFSACAARFKLAELEGRRWPRLGGHIRPST